MADTAVVANGNVSGDITSCKIENQTKSVEIKSPISLFQKTNYITYDVCNKTTIAEYSVPDFTGFGMFLCIVLGVVVICVGIGTAIRIADSY